jgi:tetratricopeptide (TPR) repeat protein
MSSEKNEQQTADVLMERAKALVGIRRWNEALKLLGQALAIAPDSSDILCNISYIKLALGEYQQSLANAERAVHYEPANEWAHRLRSHALLHLGKKSDALRAAEEAVRVAPDMSETLICLANAQIANHLLDQALKSGLRAREIAPESHETHEVLASVGIELSYWSEAEKHLRTALSLNPTSYSALNDLGLCLYRQDRNAEAWEFFMRAARINPTDETAHRNLKLVASSYLPGTGCVKETALIFTFVFVVNTAAIIAVAAIFGGPWVYYLKASICPFLIIVFFTLVSLREWPSLKQLPTDAQKFLQAEKRRGRINGVFLSVCVLNGLIILWWVGVWLLGIRQTFTKSTSGWAIFAYLVASSIICAATLFARRRRRFTI